MTIAPLQSWGLGDIIFQQTLANDWIAQGHTVVWGTLPEFVEGLQRAYPLVKYVDYRSLPIDYEFKGEKDMNGYRVLPLRWADEILGLPYKDCMKAKYMLFNMEFTRWREGAMWQRDSGKEDEILAWGKEFGGDNYKVVNKTYGSEGNHRIKIQIEGGYIEMTPSKRYSIFDWAKTLENASEIHTVSSSILYILEMLDIKCPIHLYPRPNDPNFEQVDYIFTKPYILH